MPISKAILRRFRATRSGIAHNTEKAGHTATPDDDNNSSVPATHAGSHPHEPTSERPVKRRRRDNDAQISLFTNNTELQDEGPKVTGDEEADKINTGEVNRRPTCILDLPPELYRELLTYMTPGQGVLLSIACKDLWARRYLKDNDCLRKLRRDTPQPERLQYLMLMGNDLPGHVLCSVCEKFERRRSREDEIATITSSYFAGELPCRRAQGSVSVNSRTFFSVCIHRRTLELVLRAAELGDRFGLPVSSLKQHITGRAYGVNALKTELDLCARVVRVPDSNAFHLFIRTQQSFELDLYVDHKKQIECADIEACGHETSGERSIMLEAVKKSQKDRESGGTVLSESTRVVRCRYCPGDMQVHIKRESAQCVFVTVTVTAWRDLGPRGSHTNKIWEFQQRSYSSRRFDRQPNLNSSTDSYPFGTESLKAVFERGEC